MFKISLRSSGILSSVLGKRSRVISVLGFRFSQKDFHSNLKIFFVYVVMLRRTVNRVKSKHRVVKYFLIEICTSRLSYENLKMVIIDNKILACANFDFSQPFLHFPTLQGN